MAQPLNIADFRKLAKRRLPTGVFEFLDRGSEDDVAEQNNRAAFRTIRLRPRILAGAAPRSLKSQIFGEERALPLALAPIGIAGHIWYRGEAALARAAAHLDIPFILSGATAMSLTDLAREGGDGTKWFQLYVSGDRARSLDVARKAYGLGFQALVLTVDSLVPYNREFAKRSGFDIPFRLRPSGLWDVVTHPRWLFGTMGRYWLGGGLPSLAEYPLAPQGSAERDGVAFKDDGIDWRFLDELRKAWPAKLIVKGVLDARDALLCVRHGVDGLVVSNHGGISLDCAIAPIDALPEIAAAVGKHITVMLDSGVRRGSDVVKALALGADVVLLGRAAIYGLAASGENGVVRTVEILRDEIDRILAQLGCRTAKDLTAEHVVRSVVSEEPICIASPR